MKGTVAIHCVRDVQGWGHKKESLAADTNCHSKLTDVYNLIVKKLLLKADSSSTVLKDDNRRHDNQFKYCY